MAPCTNGRMEDMRAAAAILKGRKVAQDVRVIVIPATQRIYLQCIEEGLTQIFIEAGAVVSTPTCGPVWAVTWVFWLPVSEQFPPQTETLWAVWVTRSLRFTWPLRCGCRLCGQGLYCRPGYGIRRSRYDSKGKVHKFGDNVDTDVIIPARYLNKSDEAWLASHCMEDIDKDFVNKVQPGDIMVAKANFGCGFLS